MILLRRILSCLPHKKLYIDFSTLLIKSGGHGNIIAGKTSFEIAKVLIKFTFLNNVIFLDLQQSSSFRKTINLSSQFFF